jgi:predicted nucleotidyltransferase
MVTLPESVGPRRTEIAGMIDTIVERIAPRSVILFGSYARGEATADSDVDLLVVFDHVSSHRAAAVTVYRTLTGRTLPVDIVVATPAQLERWRNVVGMIFRPALRDGIVAYARAN